MSEQIPVLPIQLHTLELPIQGMEKGEKVTRLVAHLSLDKKSGLILSQVENLVASFAASEAMFKESQAPETLAAKAEELELAELIQDEAKRKARLVKIEANFPTYDLGQLFQANIDHIKWPELSRLALGQPEKLVAEIRDWVDTNSVSNWGQRQRETIGLYLKSKASAAPVALIQEWIDQLNAEDIAEDLLKNGKFAPTGEYQLRSSGTRNTAVKLNTAATLKV